MCWNNMNLSLLAGLRLKKHSDCQSVRLSDLISQPQPLPDSLLPFSPILLSSVGPGPWQTRTFKKQ